MACQMTRVISSPSISTTVPATLIFDNCFSLSHVTPACFAAGRSLAPDRPSVILQASGNYLDVKISLSPNGPEI